MGEEYTLKVESESDTLSLKGTVIWEKIVRPTRDVRGNNFSIYEVGMSFDEVLTGQGADLLNFMSENVSDGGIKARIKGLRVKIIEPGKSVILDDRNSYDVRMIGVGGMLIESREELCIDGRSAMEMSFPEDMNPIRFLGRIAYCMEIQGKIPKCYDAGVEFIEMNEKDRARLKEFIDILQTI
ncbi:MAG: PilZ domain-containing protein [Candidatus Sulfobium sp.]